MQPSALAMSDAKKNFAVDTVGAIIKMGWMVQAESATVEFPCVLQLEHDDNVLEYYDQPNQIKLTYRAKSRDGQAGKKLGVLHTPDFLVLGVETAGWIECKPEAELVKLAEASPERYVQRATGAWCCPPGERYAEPLGLFYRVWTDAEISWHFHTNLLYLDDYFRGAAWEVGTEATQEVLSLVSQEPGLRLKDLQERVRIATADDIHRLILTDQIFVDLFNEPLSEPDQVRVFGDHWLAKIRKMTVHRIRHSFATHSLRRGIDLGHIQHQLGHSDIKTTAIYLAIEDSDRRRAHRENSPGDAI
jgi:putative transposase